MLHGEMVMTGSGPAVISQAMTAEHPETETLETRFGRLTINRTNPILFVNGLLGIPDKQQFCLTAFPSDKMARFRILQSLEDEQLSFITLPVDLDNPIVERADLEAGARDLNIPLEQLAVLLIVSVHRDATGTKLSVNARAPLMLHALNRTASQHVFSNPKYQIRQPLTV